jgi:hypothetical protein
MGEATLEQCVVVDGVLGLLREDRDDDPRAITQAASLAPRAYSRQEARSVSAPRA